MKETIYFETIKCEDYQVFHQEYHKARIANTIGKNIDIQEYIYPPNQELLKCKLTYNQDDILNIEFSPYKAKTINSIQIIYDDTIEYSKKYLNRECFEKYSNTNNSDEILIVKDGLLTDTSIANIALFINNRWITPKYPLLSGTTRSRLLYEGFLFEKDLTIKDLKSCEKFAVMNAMIGFKELENPNFSFS